MISEFKLSELGLGNPVLNSKLFNVGAAPNNAAVVYSERDTDATQTTVSIAYTSSSGEYSIAFLQCAAKSVIPHLRWQEAESKPTVFQSPPPTTSLQVKVPADRSPPRRFLLGLLYLLDLHLQRTQLAHHGQWITFRACKRTDLSERSGAALLRQSDSQKEPQPYGHTIACLILLQVGRQLYDNPVCV